MSRVNPAPGFSYFPGPPIELPELPSVTKIVEFITYESGLVLGEVVTAGLAFNEQWNRPVLGPDGKQVQQVPGAARIGDHAIRKRHQQVVGPQITRFASGLSEGFLRDTVDAFGRGATAAPGETYRLEARLSEWWDSL